MLADLVSRTRIVVVLAAAVIASASDTLIWAQARTGGVASDGGPVLTGIVRDEAGRPLAYAQVQACTSTVCFFNESGSDGRFRFELPSRPARYVVKTVEDLSMMPRHAAALAPTRVSGPTPIDLGPVYVPTLPQGSALPVGAGRQVVQPGDGLELTLSREDLAAPPGKVLARLAARRIPLDRVPRYLLPANEFVVAVFALHPLGVTSKSPIAVRALASLQPGTPVYFRTIDDIDGTLSEPVPGHVAGTHVATDASTGIRRLTHLVITAVSVQR